MHLCDNYERDKYAVAADTIKLLIAVFINTVTSAHARSACLYLFKKTASYDSNIMNCVYLENLFKKKKQKYSF